MTELIDKSHRNVSKNKPKLKVRLAGIQNLYVKGRLQSGPGGTKKSNQRVKYD